MYVSVLTYTRRGSRLCYRLIMYYLCAMFFYFPVDARRKRTRPPLALIFLSARAVCYDVMYRGTVRYDTNMNGWANRRKARKLEIWNMEYGW